ncbi:hypothetical protein EFA69_19440 [Rufibacter immobilis]|uniref:Uncharacterized protein n=1 Tax=Rufibacter immobilis TaxID=1348778 RepID=A0A3M9MRW6_9BACT|nr:DUF5691 domain-containing protein [Rufibacter immobilis]RNI28241.1 hypothetical protein EFA69_19440 [Rufibacter immobilis]
MEADLIKAAMLGTSQYVPSQLSPLAKELQQTLGPTNEDKEDAYLKLTAGFFLVSEAGQQLPELTVQLPSPPAETRLYITTEANALLRQFLRHKEDNLLEYFLFRCVAAQKTVLPEILPEVLSMAVEKKARQEALLQISGHRGQWLAQLNPAWQTLVAPEEENVWETGTWEQRKRYFKNLRARQPEQALTLLHNHLQEENTNARAELLELLYPNLSLNDEPFLTSLLTDKSQKVKQVVYQLLLQLPQSRLNQLVQAYVKAAVQVKEERVLLLAKRKVFNIHPDVPVPEELFAAGFEKTSSQKNVDDAEYWVSQAMAYVEPEFWQNSFGLSLVETVQLWANHASKPLFLPSLVQSAVRYQHRELAQTLLSKKEVTGMELLQVLPVAERFTYADRFLEENPALYLHFLLDDTYAPIPTKLNQRLLQQFALKPYALTQQQYQRWALQMEATMLPVLQQYAQQEYQEYQMRFFRNVCADMARVLHTKEQLNALL